MSIARSLTEGPRFGLAGHQIDDASGYHCGKVFAGPFAGLGGGSLDRAFSHADQGTEELAYIFLTITVGLSLGADQREAAGLGVVVILAIISFTDVLKTKDKRAEGNLLVTLDLPLGDPAADDLEKATNLLGQVCREANDASTKGSGRISLTCLTRFEGLAEGGSTAFKKVFPEGSFTIIDDFAFPHE